MLRSLLLLALALCVASCASQPFKPLEFPPQVVLQDPAPGAAIVYLLRAPHDKQSIAVFLQGKKVASLPPETFTAVSVKPGTYTVSSVGPGSPEPPGAEPSVLTVSAGERRFLYTTVPTRGETMLYFAPIPGGGAIPLVVPSRLPAGARYWRECSEADAQGLMSIATLVLPEPNAL